jgi:hypothetical protein
LTLQLAPELSTTFTLNGYQPQTVSVRSEEGSTFSSPKFAPNPVYVELKRAQVAPAAKKRIKRPPAEAKRPGSSVASAAPAVPTPAPASDAAPASSPAPEAAASATNYPWPAPSSAK